jgi:hypothetical protein
VYTPKTLTIRIGIVIGEGKVIDLMGGLSYTTNNCGLVGIYIEAQKPFSISLFSNAKLDIRKQ